MRACQQLHSDGTILQPVYHAGGQKLVSLHLHTSGESGKLTVTDLGPLAADGRVLGFRSD